MSGTPQYCDRVRALFADPCHAGSLAGPAVTLSRGAHTIELSAVVDGQQVAQLAFRVFGCPHLIAAAELFCEEFEGRPVPALAGFSAQETSKKLEIPVEKTGQILLLEDAIRGLRAELDEVAPVNAT